MEIVCRVADRIVMIIVSDDDKEGDTLKSAVAVGALRMGKRQIK